MRCLYCSQHFEEENLLKKHYENNHKVDINNWFFKSLFKQKKKHIFLAENVIVAKAFWQVKEKRRNITFSFIFKKVVLSPSKIVR